MSDNLIQNPFVSVVIPSYNRADTVLQTIESIVTQQCDFDFELIIGDDCSTDNVRDVLLAYQTQYPAIIKLLFHNENIGLGANWATCVKHCRGKYIANCDNDDYWHNPQKLQLQVDFMEQNPQYGLCHTDFRVHNRKTGKIIERQCATISQNAKNDIQTQQQSIIKGGFVCCNATVMYRKEVLLKYVSMDDYITYRFTLQDWNTWMLLAPFTEFGCLHVSTATFGVETYSITRARDANALETRWRREKPCFKYICEKFPDDLPYNEKEYDDYANLTCLNLSYETVDYRSAKKYALRCNDSFKVRCAQNRLLFYPVAIAGKIKRKYFL